MYFNLIDIVNSLSCFQLALFAFFLLHKGRKSLSNRILATFFITQFIVIFNWVLRSKAFESHTEFQRQIAYLYYPFIFLWGPLIYFYIKSQVKTGFAFSLKDLIHLIPFGIALLFILSNYYIGSDIDKNKCVTSGALFHWFFYFNFPYFALLFGYNAIALHHIIQYQKAQREYCSFEVKQNLIWLKLVLYGYIIACLINLIITSADQYLQISPETRMLTVFTPFLLFFNILFYKALISPYIIILPPEKPRYINSNLANADIETYAKIIRAYLTTHKSFLNPTLKLSDLALATGIPERSISQVINQHCNQNFFSFINAYRVEEAKILLNSFDQDKTTMLAICYDAGFNSKTAFYDAFKKQTGITPSEYRKAKV